jgi:hypothetical protein
LIEIMANWWAESAADSMRAIRHGNQIDLRPGLAPSQGVVPGLRLRVISRIDCKEISVLALTGARATARIA